MPQLRSDQDLTFSAPQQVSLLFRQRSSNSIQAGICGHSMHSSRSANLGSCAATHPSSAASARGHPNEYFGHNFGGEAPFRSSAPTLHTANGIAARSRLGMYGWLFELAHFVFA